MSINKFLEQNRRVKQIRDYTFVEIRNPVQCVDGFSMSVQASRTHYCSPRSDMGPYAAVEVGYPSAADDLLAPYAEEDDNLTGTVYGYVPVEVVDAVIVKHGGIANV